MWFGPVLILIVLGYRYRWTFDDGFIYFRVAEQILAANGPVFNAGERVEAFTSPLWLALLTLGSLMSPARLEVTAAVLSIGCTVGGMVLAVLGAARLSRCDHRTALRLPVGLVILVALWPVWVWSTGGMEVGLTYLWIGAALYALAQWATNSRPPPRRLMVLLGLGWLVRPELLIASLLYAALPIGFAERGSRRRLVLAAAAAPAVYQLFRMGYYGAVVAMPAITKEGTHLRPALGWSYFEDFLRPYALAVPLLAVLVGVCYPMTRSLAQRGERRSCAVIAAMCGSGVATATYIVLVGGDYVHARLLLPSLFAFLAPFFVVAATRRYVEGLLVTFAWAALCGIVLRPDGSRQFDYDADADGVNDGWNITVGWHGTSLTIEDRGFARRGLDQPWIEGGGLYIADTFAADGVSTGIAVSDADEVVVAAFAIGATGYALGPEARIVDLHGLAEPVTAHQRLEFRSLPGHEKLASAAWVVATWAAEPNAVTLDQFPVTAGRWPVPTRLEFLEQVAWAQAALRCEPILQLRDATYGPLTATRFVSNIWRAVPNSLFRVGRDPEAAFEERCGPGVPAEVSTFQQDVMLAERLPPDAVAGQLVVIEQCTVVFRRSAGDTSTWWPIDGGTFRATVGFPSVDARARLAAVWTLGPVGGSNAWVWAETDAQGRYRMRLDVPWLPPVLQAWAPIPLDGNVDVTLEPQIASGRWQILVDDQRIAELPMSVVERAATNAVVPQPAGPSSTAGRVTVDQRPVEPSPTCRAILEHRGARG